MLLARGFSIVKIMFNNSAPILQLLVSVPLIVHITSARYSNGDMKHASQGHNSQIPSSYVRYLDQVLAFRLMLQ